MIILRDVSCTTNNEFKESGWSPPESIFSFIEAAGILKVQNKGDRGEKIFGGF